MLDRSWKLKKLSFYRESSYDTVKKICQEATWPEEEDGVTFYVADGSGVSIETERFEVRSNDERRIIFHGPSGTTYRSPTSSTHPKHGFIVFEFQKVCNQSLLL